MEQHQIKSGGCNLNRRQRIEIGLSLLAVLIGVGGSVYFALTPLWQTQSRPRYQRELITQANFSRIKTGMPLTEVHAILGLHSSTEDTALDHARDTHFTWFGNGMFTYHVVVRFESPEGSVVRTWIDK